MGVVLEPKKWVENYFGAFWLGFAPAGELVGPDGGLAVALGPASELAGLGEG